MSWCVTINAELVATTHSLSMTKRQARDLAESKGPGWIPIRCEDIHLNKVSDRVEVRPGLLGKYRSSLERYGR